MKIDDDALLKITLKNGIKQMIDGLLRTGKPIYAGKCRLSSWTIDVTVKLVFRLRPTWLVFVQMDESGHVTNRSCAVSCEKSKDSDYVCGSCDTLLALWCNITISQLSIVERQITVIRAMGTIKTSLSFAVCRELFIISTDWRPLPTCSELFLHIFYNKMVCWDSMQFLGTATSPLCHYETVW